MISLKAQNNPPNFLELLALIQQDKKRLLSLTNLVTQIAKELFNQLRTHPISNSVKWGIGFGIVSSAWYYFGYGAQACHELTMSSTAHLHSASDTNNQAVQNLANAGHAPGYLIEGVLLALGIGGMLCNSAYNTVRNLIIQSVYNRYITNRDLPKTIRKELCQLLRQELSQNGASPVEVQLLTHEACSQLEENNAFIDTATQTEQNL